VKTFVKRLLHGRAFYFFFMGLRRFLGRNFLLSVSVVFFAAYLWFTHGLLEKVQTYMAQKAALYVERIELGLSGSMDAPFVRAMITAIIENSDLPVVVTDSLGMPIAWTRLGNGRLFTGKTVGESDTTSETAGLLRAKAAEMQKEFAPLPIRREGTGEVTGYLVIGRSSVLSALSLLSFGMGGVFVIFIVLMYIAFYNMRINERRGLWVALAKETAHQLGTPISALMGWVEFLRSTKDPESTATPQEVLGQIEKICGDMENDLKRLRRISTRFSHIGSVPVLTPCDVNAVIDECLEYYRVRLPLLKRKIELRRQFGDLPLVNANSELLEWVFENLLRNSVDAIRHTEGKIEIRTEFVKDENLVRVYHSDNGSGIKWEAHKKIFSPGYTTKKRGWGLGLTLAKRIVEDYHQGKIFVHWSKKDKGATFCVELPVSAKSGRPGQSDWFTS
jgi:two-component system, NtrC family, sensor histidine kinase KinB